MSAFILDGKELAAKLQKQLAIRVNVLQ